MKKKRSMLVILGVLFLSLSVVGGASASPQDNSYADTGGGSKSGGGGSGGGIKPDLKDSN